MPLDGIRDQSAVAPLFGGEILFNSSRLLAEYFPLSIAPEYNVDAST